jgi:hypothetical protein
MLLLVLVATDISEYYEYWSSGFKNLTHSHHALQSICNRIPQVLSKSAFLHQFNVDSSIKYLAMLFRVYGLHCIKGEDYHEPYICKDIRCGNKENVFASRIMKEKEGWSYRSNHFLLYYKMV